MGLLWILLGRGGGGVLGLFWGVGGFCQISPFLTPLEGASPIPGLTA